MLGSGERAAQVAGALEAVDLPIFVARWQEAGGGRLQVGTLEGSEAKVRGRIASALAMAGIAADVRVRLHRAKSLRRVRSLELLLRRTGSGTLVFDRTRALVRAEAVVALGADLRAALGGAISELYFHADRRVLYVVLANGRQRDAASGEAVAAAMRQVASAATRGAAALSTLGADVAIRVGYSAPPGLDLIAVDERTARATLLKLLRWPPPRGVRRAALGALLGATVSVPAFAGGPAVEAPNFTVTVLGGSDKIDFEDMWAGLGAQADLPLGQNLGVQVEGEVGADQYYGAAAHLFARDPDLGLVGLLLSAESRNGVSLNRVGVEGEFYLNDNFTVSGVAGYQSGDVKNGGYGRLDLSFYPDPNMMLTVGGELRPDMNLARAGFEWQPAVDSLPGLSVFGDATLADTGDYQVLFGLNFQIGADGSLLDRQRRFDPPKALNNPTGYGEHHETPR